MEAEELNQKDSSSNSLFKSKKFLLLILLLVLLTATFTLVNFSNIWFKSQKIEEITIKETDIVDRQRVSEIANKIAIAKTKDSVLLKKIELEIEKFEYVENCIANFSGINSIEINIDEKEPIAFYLVGDKLKYLGENAEILPYKNLKNYSDLIIISDVKTSEQELLKGAIEIVNSIKNSDFLNILTSEIHYNRNLGYFELYGNFANGRVIFGNSSRVNSKLENLKNFLNKYTKYKNVKTNYHLDIRWKNRVIIKEI